MTASCFFIQIPFDSLTFLATSGKKTDVDVQISDGGVQFKGALSFVQDLADYLSFAGSGLVIDTSGAAITATLKLAIPSLTVGVFSLTNLAFDAGVAIPYNGDPVRFEFSFCTRDDPFALTIMIFTGGGFVGIGIGADGVELLEFSFDFGLGYLDRHRHRQRRDLARRRRLLRVAEAAGRIAEGAAHRLHQGKRRRLMPRHHLGVGRAVPRAHLHQRGRHRAR